MHKKILLFVFLIIWSCSSKDDNDNLLKDKQIERLILEVQIKDSEIKKLEQQLEGSNESYTSLKPDENASLLIDLLISEEFHKTSVELRKIDSTSLAPYVIYEVLLRNTFSNSSGYEGYQGQGIIIVDHSLAFNKMVWSYIDRYSDFPPHTFSFLDFNGDGKKDLYTFAGFEDVFNTNLFINQTGSDRKEPFKLVFSNGLSYCPLFDFNHDGIPEILSSTNEIEDLPLEGQRFTNLANTLIMKEYDKIVGSFNQYNYDYNMPSTYKEFSLELFSDVKILSINSDSIVDVSHQYPDHFKFRIQVLNEIETDSKEIMNWINQLKAQAKGYLEN